MKKKHAVLSRAMNEGAATTYETKTHTNTHKQNGGGNPITPTLLYSNRHTNFQKQRSRSIEKPNRQLTRKHMYLASTENQLLRSRKYEKNTYYDILYYQMIPYKRTLVSGKQPCLLASPSFYMVHPLMGIVFGSVSRFSPLLQGCLQRLSTTA